MPYGSRHTIPAYRSEFYDFGPSGEGELSGGTAIEGLDFHASRFAGAVGARNRSGAPAATPVILSFSTHRTGPTIKDVSGLPLVFDGAMPVLDPPARPVSLAIKRAMDIVVSLGALLVLAPVLLATAAAIKATSRGPVLFCQMRDGLNGRPIRVYKFRSMYLGRGDVTGVAQTVADDPRITPIGRIIRRANIDELPQFLNILRGEMSLIGPRPHPIGMLSGGIRYEEMVPYYHLRHVMKPGLSGWAQANGYRGPTQDPRLARARIDHDLAYIANFSLWLDLKTLVRTVVRESAGGSGS